MKCSMNNDNNRFWQGHIVVIYYPKFFFDTKPWSHIFFDWEVQRRKLLPYETKICWFSKRSKQFAAILDVCGTSEKVKVCKQIPKRDMISVVHHKPTIEILFKIRKFIITQTLPFSTLFRIEEFFIIPDVWRPNWKVENLPTDLKKWSWYVHFIVKYTYLIVAIV